MGFLNFMADPIGVYDIIKPSGQGSSSAPTREQHKEWVQKTNAVGEGASSAAGAASSAGAYASAQHNYAAGGHWSPGMPAPAQPGTVAYNDYQAYQRGMSNAAGAASAAGTHATQVHNTQAKQQATQQATAEDAARKASGLDMMKPGAAEQFYADHGGDLTQPGNYQQWWNSNGAQMQNPGMAENYANSVLQKYGNSNPSLPPADYGAYYDRAATKATQGLNDQLASRGQYGSSVGLGLIGTQLADLAAQRSRDEADYGLRRSGEERAWTSALGDVAHMGESDSLARWSAGGQGAAMGDTLGLARWKTGQQAAVDAQQSQRQRGQDLFNNERGIGGDLSAMAGSAYGSNSATDAALLDAILALKTGKASEGVSAAQAGANQDAATQNQLMQLLQAYYASQAQPAKK